MSAATGLITRRSVVRCHSSNSRNNSNSNSRNNRNNSTSSTAALAAQQQQQQKQQQQQHSSNSSTAATTATAWIVTFKQRLWVAKQHRGSTHDLDRTRSTAVHSCRLVPQSGRQHAASTTLPNIYTYAAANASDTKQRWLLWLPYPDATTNWLAAAASYMKPQAVI